MVVVCAQIPPQRSAVRSASLFGEDGRVQRAFGREVLNTNASLTPAALAISLVVVPLNPFAANRFGGNQAGLAIVAGVAGSGVRRVHVIRRLVVSDYSPLRYHATTKCDKDREILFTGGQAHGDRARGTKSVRDGGKLPSSFSLTRNASLSKKSRPGWFEDHNEG